jgi:hypothetical protein
VFHGLDLWFLLSRAVVRHLSSAFPVETGHELAVDLSGGFEFLGALSESLLGAGEGLLELPGALGRAGVLGGADLAEDVLADDLAEAPAQGGEVGFEPTVAAGREDRAVRPAAALLSGARNSDEAGVYRHWGFRWRVGVPAGGRDGQDPLDQVRVLGVAQRGVAEQ